MKTVMAVLVALPALMASALPARAQSAGAATLKPAMTLRPQIPCGDRHPVQPLNGGLDRMPYGPDVPCPEIPGPKNPGPEPLPYPGPRHPRPWEDRVEGKGVRFSIEKVGAALSAGERGIALAAMFDGTGFSVTGNDAVVFAGAAPRPTGVLQGPVAVREKAVVTARAGVPQIRLVACGDGKEGCRSETGKLVEDAVKPVTDAIDRLGDRLRDRNDDKLREGTQRQKDAEKDVRERKEKQQRERPTV